MLKKIVMLITCILFIGLVVFLQKEGKEEERILIEAEKTDDAKRPLLVKKQKLIQQIEDLEGKYQVDKAIKATTQVVFTDLKEEVYSVCYPILKEYDYTGTMVLSLSQLPGMEGLMAIDQFKHLVAEGWDICIKWDSQADVKTWWPQLQEKLKDLGVEAATIVYFTAGTYSKDLDEQLQKMGFSIVVHHGEEETPLIQTADEEGIWHLGAVGLMGEKPKLRLTEAIAQKGNVTYLVGFELEDEKYDERAFRSMLGYFHTYETNMELDILNMEEAREYSRNRYNADGQVIDEAYQKERAALEEQLKALEEEIDKVQVK